jgi:uncharacterized integral membrane protein (TIGR00697 family)
MWILVTLWILSILLATVFMSFYIRKYNKPEGITAIYVIYLALSQILALKIVTIGMWAVPAAVLIYPFTYQLTDTMNEHFGRKETFKMIVIAFITQVLMVLFIFFGNSLPAFDFGPITDEQWLIVFNQQFAVIASSWISFLVTGFLDAMLFDKVKKMTKGKLLWVRSVLSDLPMLALDSLIFITLAFGLFEQNPDWNFVFQLVSNQMFTKWIFGIIDTPFIYLDRFIVYKYNKNEIPNLDRR